MKNISFKRIVNLVDVNQLHEELKVKYPDIMMRTAMAIAVATKSFECACDEYGICKCPDCFGENCRNIMLQVMNQLDEN